MMNRRTKELKMENDEEIVGTEERRDMDAGERKNENRTSR